LFNFYEKESFKVTIIPSWDSAGDVQYINICRHGTIHTLYTGWLKIFMYIFVYNCTHRTFSWKSVPRDVRTPGFCINPNKEYWIFSTAQPRWSCVNREMGPPTSYFPVCFCFWARILKNLLEAEKSTFQEELSFQRSKSTTGLKQITFFCKYISITISFEKIKTKFN
jgi:hypothetical protein